MTRLEGKLTVSDACFWARVSRAGYYRHWDEHAPREARTALQDAIQRVALEHDVFGYRKVTEQLRREG